MISAEIPGGKADCIHQWHRKMGHRDIEAVQRLSSLSDGIIIEKCDCNVGESYVCQCCLKGKMTRKPFPRESKSRAAEILDLVHSDLCGPMAVTTPSGNRYVLTLIDDFSRLTVIYLLKQKSETAGKIMEYVRMTENLCGKKMEVIRSDNGGEYTSKELREFYKAEGIQCQLTVPYSPQQNGVAERENRSLIEMTRCQLIDSGLNQKYWGEAILTANYNRCPSKSVNTTPFEMFFKKKPDLENIQIFGSEAFVHIQKEKRKKLDCKSQKMVFVGYSPENKGWIWTRKLIR
jgi:hypothetical protein